VIIYRVAYNKMILSAVVSVKFIVRKKWFVAGSEDSFIHVYKYETKVRRNLSFKAHIHQLKSLAVHPTKPYLLSSCSHVMKLWDWDKGWEHIQTFKSKYPGSVCQLAFNPKNTNCFVTASDNHIVEVCVSTIFNNHILGV
jgi:coatomer subunit beta'